MIFQIIALDCFRKTKITKEFKKNVNVIYFNVDLYATNKENTLY